MDLFENVVVTSSFLPVLWEEEEEILCLMQDKTRLYSGEQKTNMDNGTSLLTTHRYIWLEKAPKGKPTVARRAIGIHLSKVTRVKGRAGFLPGMLSSPKIAVYVHREESSSEPSGLVAPGYFLISFRSSKGHIRDGGKDAFLKKFHSVLSSKAWIRAKMRREEETAGAAWKREKELFGKFDASVAGVGGIMTMIERRDKAAEASVSSAFKDLRAMMDAAQELVRLADRYAKVLREKQGASEGGSDENKELDKILFSAGIANPISKKLAGSEYHQLLARQFSDFLTPYLEKGGGSITLVDAYCQYNRARPTDMISPEDLLKACENLRELRLPIEFHRYDSGVQMISLVDMKVKEVDVLEWIRNVEVNQSSKKMVGVTEVDVAANFKFSVIIAKQQLLAMEKKTLVCRDETLQGGLRFYSNQILQ